VKQTTKNTQKIENNRLLVTVTVWYRTKRPMHCGHLCSNHSWFIRQSSLANTSRHLIANQG